MFLRLKIYTGFCLLFFSVFYNTHCQILKDTNSVDLLKKCVYNIYNFNFEPARKYSSDLKKMYPEHPVIYLLQGMLIYWENYPLRPDNPAAVPYENALRKCIKICEETSSPPDNSEYLLANLGARGLLLMHYADNNLSDKVFPLAKTTYKYLRQSFDHAKKYPDFLFFTGLYNYYREAYPDAHPVYKVLAILFPRGDKEKGLNELKTAAQYSIMLKAESAFFLSHIFIHYENDFNQAYTYGRYLNRLYPYNLQYLELCLKSMFLARMYDEAEELLIQISDIYQNQFLSGQIAVFNGLLQEKKYRNFNEAGKYYSDGLAKLTEFGFYGNEYSSYAYFGLSRIADTGKDKNLRKLYRRKALDLTINKKISFDD